MVLLIQFRTDQAGWHEVKNVYDALSVPYSDIRIINAASENVSSEDIQSIADKSNAVLIGGLGEGGYEETSQKWERFLSNIIVKMEPVITKLVEKDDKPVLGFCFGIQLMSDILGGEITTDHSYSETGYANIRLTEEGQKDPIFKGFSKTFISVVGHKTSVKKAPCQAVLLAATKNCPIQAYRIGKYVYATQFHAELNHEDLMFRLNLYPGYANNKHLAFDKRDIFVKKMFNNLLALTSEL